MYGSSNIQERMPALPQVGNTLRISPELMNWATALPSEKQDVYEKSRGTHATLIFDGNGNAVSFAEDIGPHNALDKAMNNRHKPEIWKYNLPILDTQIVCDLKQTNLAKKIKIL